MDTRKHGVRIIHPPSTPSTTGVFFMRLSESLDVSEEAEMMQRANVRRAKGVMIIMKTAEVVLDQVRS